ncbi:MAG TPA: alkaline phosphatase family protein, partial [Pirellulales bacterium]
SVAAAVVLALALGACGGEVNGAAGVAPPSGPLAADARYKPSGKIQHVVIIIQENRSFDDLFQGYPGADTQAYGYTSTGAKLTLQPVSLATRWDIGHNATSFFDACDGTGSLPGTDCKMDGFNLEPETSGGGRNQQYSYVPASETKPYVALAKQYVLADRMFGSNFDSSSFVSHQYIIAGQASSTVDYPDNVWGCDGGPSDKISTITTQRSFGPRIPACFDNLTLGDELDSAKLSWRYYASALDKSGDIWSAYQAIDHIRNGPDWKTNVASPQTRFLKDVKSGNLPVVSWVTPTAANSDHAGYNSKHGPAWVASLVNAVGNSKYWDSTAIFIFWDDYGGWYDHVPPPLEDYDSLGIRVPLLIVSPYAKKGWVSHVQYEHGSILRFVEDQFKLPRLSATDKRAKSPEKDCF